MSHRLPAILNKVPSWVAILLVVGIVPRVVVYLASMPILWPDSLTYLASAKQMAYNGNYWMHEIYRTPMYPLFLSQFLNEPHDAVRAGKQIIVVQQLFGIISGLLFFLTLRRAFTEKVALWGAILFLLSPLQLVYEATILTEAQFTLFLALFLWLAGRVIEGSSQNRLPLILCVTLGLSAAVLSLSRPIGQLLLIVVWGFCLVRFGFTRRIMLGAALAGAVFVASILPWMKVNHDHYGFWGISRDFGINIFHRVLDVDDTPLPEKSSDEFVRNAYIQAKPKPNSSYFRVYFALLRQIKKEGTPPQLVKLTADKRLGDFALEVLRSHPFLFIPKSIGHLWRLFFNPRPSLHFCNDGPTLPYLCSNHPGIVSHRIASDPRLTSESAKRVALNLFSILRIPDAVFGLLFSIGVIVGLRGPRVEQRLLLLFTVAYFTGIAAVFNCPEDRFRLPVDALIYAYAAVGIAWMLRRFFRRGAT